MKEYIRRRTATNINNLAEYDVAFLNTCLRHEALSIYSNLNGCEYTEGRFDLGYVFQITIIF